MLRLILISFCCRQLLDVAQKLGPALQVGESLVWSNSNQSSRGSSQPQPRAQTSSEPESEANSMTSAQEDGSFV